ncbi:nuclear hormone receptor FTZ-F1-like [Teratosphaeria destructans]|uniref:Nuclear hormone receptor FTZ-F1-like n=1 Tax=Teratosphaeria destructans TaxID=418781 RepID=A0A9W7SYN8_9PEZI|nr:nuclear hormone receptor FTZ-F1-like [Teratosphaeria destructans]
MSTARWSLRLPRNSTTLVRSNRRSIRRVEYQRRWIQKPPPRSRPWASLPEKDDRNSRPQHHQDQIPQHEHPGPNTQLANVLAESNSSDLLSEVRIPDDPDGVLPPDHPALALLGNSSLVIQRQIEFMNIMIGFEQANRYIIMNGQGQTIGYIAEKDHGLGTAVARQMFKTHRSFTTHIFDAQEREVLRIHRPFAYINSKIRIYDPVPEGGYQNTESSTALQGTSAISTVNQGSVAQVSPLKLEEMRVIGEAQQQWHVWRRKYNLFSFRPLPPASDDPSTPKIESGEKATSETMALTEAKAPEQAIEAGMVQFAHVDEPLLSWDFNLRGEDQSLVGSVNRNFGGFAREIFTDTGVYALRMDSAAQSSVLESADGKEVDRYEKHASAMTLDQRAVMLATAVSIDFDYFSRHSHVGSGGGFMPIFWPMGGGAAEGGAAGAGAGAAGGAAEAGTAVGAAEGVGGAAAGAAGRGVAGAGGMAEGGMVGAGSVAGYEAMQRGSSGSPQRPSGDDASPTNNDPYSDQQGQTLPQGQGGQQEEVWGEGQDPWGESPDPWGGGGGPGDGPPPPSAGGEGGGGGWLDSLSDFFSD